MANQSSVRALRALANAKRLDLLFTLRRSGARTLTDLASSIRLSIKSTQKHLTLLLAAGLVESERRGRYVYYHLSPADNWREKLIALALR